MHPTDVLLSQTIYQTPNDEIQSICGSYKGNSTLPTMSVVIAVMIWLFSLPHLCFFKKDFKLFFVPIIFVEGFDLATVAILGDGVLEEESNCWVNINSIEINFIVSLCMCLALMFLISCSIGYEKNDRHNFEVDVDTDLESVSISE